MTDWEAYNNWAYLTGPMKPRSRNVKLTKEQKAAVAKIIQASASRARHQIVHSDHDLERRAFYEQVAAEAEALLPLFEGREAVEVEEDEEEEQDDE